MLKTIFVETVIHFIFRDSQMNNTYNTVYVFTVTFDQFNVSLINKKKWRKNILIGNVTVSTKILCSSVGNIDNNQNFLLSSKSAYYYDFWRSCDTEDWSNDAENTEINYSLTHIHIENSYLKLK